MKPGADRRLVAEIPAERHDPDPPIGGGDRIEERCRAIAAAVVDEEDLEIDGGVIAERRDDPPVRCFDDGRLVEDGQDDGQQRP